MPSSEIHTLQRRMGIPSITSIKSRNGDQLTVELLDQTVTLNMAATPAASQIEALLRPESLLLRRNPALKQGHIASIMYLGSELEYMVRDEGGNLLIVIQNNP